MDTLSIILTFGLYLLFVQIKNKTKKAWLNPLLLSALSIIVLLKSFKIDYETYNQGVKFITYLLLPATVSLAIPLYENKALILKYSRQIFISIFAGIITHALSLVFLKYTLSFSHEIFASTLSKSVTTAIAKDITAQLGGVVEITIPLVIITGIFGALISQSVFKLFNIKSKVSKGLALGVSAHAVGTATAVELGEIEAAMASIALILTGILTVFLSPLILRIFS